MSVWTKVQTKVLARDVDMKLFEKAMADLDLTLDYSTKKIKNGFGNSTVDAALKYKGELKTLGIVRNQEGGIDLLGDTWRSGIVGDKQADKLVNMMSQAYANRKLQVELEAAGWDIVSKKVGNKIELEITQW